MNRPLIQKKKINTDQVCKRRHRKRTWKQHYGDLSRQKNIYWFGSWETGVYKYDGKTLINYTTKHGLLNNRIDEIKEDKFGNIYFASANATSSISKFDGKISRL
jgi:hypothetical protein